MKAFRRIVFFPAFIIIEIYAEKWGKMGLKYFYTGIFPIDDFMGLMKFIFSGICMFLTVGLFMSIIMATTQISPDKKGATIACFGGFLIFRVVRFIMKLGTYTSEEQILYVLFTILCLSALLQSMKDRVYTEQYPLSY